MKFFVEKDKIGKVKATIRADFDAKLDGSMVGRFVEVSEREYKKEKAGLSEESKRSVGKSVGGGAIFTPGGR